MPNNSSTKRFEEDDDSKSAHCISNQGSEGFGVKDLFIYLICPGKLINLIIEFFKNIFIKTQSHQKKDDIPLESSKVTSSDETAMQPKSQISSLDKITVLPIQDREEMRNKEEATPKRQPTPKFSQINRDDLSIPPGILTPQQHSERSIS